MGQLRAVRRAGGCSAASVLCCWLCPVPTQSHRLAQHHGRVQASYGPLQHVWPGRGHILTSFQERGWLVS